MTKIRRTAAVMGLTIAAVFGFSGVATADVIAEGNGVRGRGDWTWGYASLTNVYLGVRDTACDDKPVYVHLRVWSKQGDTFDTTPRYNYGGCGSAKNWYGLRVDDGFYIAGVKVRACVDNWGTDSCYVSEYHDNPNT